MIRPGMMIKQVLLSIFKEPATILYPFKKRRSEIPDKFRGKIVCHAELCIGCTMCVKDCPSGAITVNKVGEKRFEVVIDMAKCIYCAQCVDSCPKKALEATREYELAVLDREQLKVTFNAGPGTDITK